VAVVGSVPPGLPQLTFPRFSLADFTALLAGAFSIAFLAMGETVGMGRSFALKHHYDLDSDQELIGLGVANIGTSLFQGFAVDGSMSTSATAEASGGKTQLTGLISASFILLTLLLTWAFGRVNARLNRHLPSNIRPRIRLRAQLIR
jgi:MFS superfamily sulfate permease-like transporter